MDLTSFLDSFLGDPWTYGPVLLLYTIAATVFLPIPEEVGLLDPFLPWYLLVLILAVGKTIGAALIYPLGDRLGRVTTRWVERLPWLAPWFDRLQGLVGRYGAYALYAILSIPFMTDTLPIYAFALLNPPKGERRIAWLPFLSANFFAGLTRGTLFLAVPLLLGWP